MNNLAWVGERERSCKPLVKTAKAACRSRAAPKVRASGFTLVEILIVIAILLTIAALAIPTYLAAVDQARIARAVADIRTIGNGVLGYEVINQQYPDTLDQVGYGPIWTLGAIRINI